MGGTPLSRILLKRMENLQRSKALVQSSTVTMGLVPCLSKCCTVSITSQVHCVVLVCGLNPNCRLSLPRRGPHKRRITFSKTFRIKDEPAIALYNPVLEGSYSGDLSRGRKLHTSKHGVILPWVTQPLNMTDSCSNIISGACSSASVVKQALTSVFLFSYDTQPP